MLTIGEWQAYASARFFPLASMPDKLPDGFLSKPDALDKYRKPERTFQRRLAKALRIRDEEFLSHFYLVTSDSAVRKGTDVAEGEVDRLKGQGLYPVWHIEDNWFANEYDNKTSGRAGGKSPKEEPATPHSAPSKNRSSLDRDALVTEIESLHRELEGERGHNKLITQQLAIKDEQILAANKIALESNVCEKEYSSLLKELAGRIPSLEAGNETTDQGNARTITVEPASAPQEVTPVAAQVEIIERKEPIPKTARATKQRKATKKKAAPKKRTAKKKTRKPKWYETPTLDRLLSR